MINKYEKNGCVHWDINEFHYIGVPGCVIKIKGTDVYGKFKLNEGFIPLFKMGSNLHNN